MFKLCMMVLLHTEPNLLLRFCVNWGFLVTFSLGLVSFSYKRWGCLFFLLYLGSSPDSNPIKNMWFLMMDRIGCHFTYCTTNSTHRIAIQEEWNAITADEIASLITRFHSRQTYFCPPLRWAAPTNRRPTLSNSSTPGPVIAEFEIYRRPLTSTKRGWEETGGGYFCG